MKHEELDKYFAYSNGAPICAPSQMIPELAIFTATEPISAEWKKNLRDSWWSSVYEGEIDAKCRQLFPLKDKLLSFAGEEVCLPVTEDDLDALVQRGQLWYGDRVIVKEGEPCHCHSNSIYLWDDNRHSGGTKVCFVTGYGLSKDGMWRQHSWCVFRPNDCAEPYIVETTVKRLLYFGVIYDDKEAQAFLEYH